MILDNYVTPVKSRFIQSDYREIPGMGLARVNMRFDDECGNGHNTFAITLDSKAQHAGAFGGCMHDKIAEVWPEYAHLIKWHLCSTEGPLHYVANTVYHMEQGNLEYARSTAIACKATAEQLLDKEWLEARLPEVLQVFSVAMTSIDWEI